MADEQQQQQQSSEKTLLSGGSEQQQQQQAPQFTPSYDGIIDQTGAFSADWTKKALAADYEGPLSSIKNLTDLDKVLRDNIAAARSRSLGITPPTDKSTPEEIKAWRAAIGAPETPDGYGDLKPEKFPDAMWDKESAKALTGIFHKHHLPPAAVKDILGHYSAQVEAQMEKGGADFQAHLAGEESKLRSEWKGDYEANTRQALRFAATLGLQADNPIFTNADVVRAMAQGAKLISEDKLINGNTIGLAASPKEQANAIMTDDKHPMYAKYQAGDKDAVALVTNLLSQGG